jgi:hypothetical protein
MVYIANDTKTSLLAIVEENEFFELENFLKYVHFAYKLASFCPRVYFFEILGHVIDICKYAWVDLMKKYFKPLHTIFSTIAYQQDFKGVSKTCALKAFCHTQSFTIYF